MDNRYIRILEWQGIWESWDPRARGSEGLITITLFKVLDNVAILGCTGELGERVEVMLE